MAADGSVIIEVTLDDGSVVSGLANINGQLGNTGNQGSSVFGRIGKGIGSAAKLAGGLALGVGAIGAAAIGISAPFVKAAADVQALNAQFSSVFGTIEKDAASALQAIGTETGVATGRLKGSFVQIAAFAKTAGADTAEALDISSRATLVAADSAAFYDRSIEEVTENLQSFLKGNYENDAALGISANEATRNAAAFELFGSKFQNLTEIQKQQTLLKLVEDGNALGGALGQAARETGGLENVLGNLRDAFTTLQAAIGEQFLDIAVSGIQALTRVINGLDITPFVEGFGRFREIVSNVLDVVIPIIQERLEQLRTLWQENGTSILETVTNAFNLVKGVIESVINAVVPFVQAQLAVITQFWNENGTQILTAVTNAFNAVKAVIDFVMPAIQLVIQLVWDAIKNIITGALDVILGLVKVFSGVFTGDFSKVWEGIKQIFGGAIDFILGLMTLTFFGGIRTVLLNLAKSGTSIITNLWGTLRGLFSSGAGGINSVVSNLVTKVIGFFRNLATNSAQTITSFSIRVVTTIGKLADDMIRIISGLPAKFLTYGKNIVQGLIDGISQLASKAVNAIGDLANKVIDKVTGVFDINSPSRVMRQLGVFVGQGLALGVEDTEKMNESAISGVAKVLSNAAKDVAKEVNEISAKAEQERTKVQKTYADKRAAAERTNATKTKNNTKKNLVDINKINRDEQEALKKINDKASNDISKKEQTVFSERLKALKTYVDDKKSTNELSASAEAEIYRKSLALFKEGSKERVEVQKAQNAALKKLYDEVTTINEDYTKKSNDINQKFNDDSKKINDDYNNQLNSRIDSLRSFKGLFDEFTIDYEVSGQTLLQNLNAQVSGFRRFQNELSTLTSRGISSDLVNELRQLGPNAVSEIAALNRLSDVELTEYSNLFGEKTALARTQAESELVGLRNSADVEIGKLRQDAVKQLDDLNLEWSERLKQTTGVTGSELSKLKQIGVDSVKGLLEGLSSNQSSLVNKAKEIGASIKSALQGSLNGDVNVNTTSSLPISNPLQGVPLNLGNGNISSGISSAANKANAALNANKTSVNIQPAPVLLDGKKIADVTFLQASQNIYKTTSINGLMKGVNVK